MIQDQWLEAINESIDEWGIKGQVKVKEISQHILNRTTFWTVTLPDGSTLALVRLYSPVIQRQEVFLGNVLLNDFLFKTLPRAIRKARLGEAVSLLNDLESNYILWHGSGDLEALRIAFYQEVLSALPEFYFGPQDIKHGIHGDIQRMLTFYKCNIEPFPTFIIPQAYLGHLMTVVGEWLRTLVGQDGDKALADADYLPIEQASSRRINVVLSLLSFFYGQDGYEMQSFYTFLDQAMQDGRLPNDLVKAAFGLTADVKLTKKIFNAQKSSGAVDFEALAQATEILLQTADTAIVQGHPQDIAPYLGTNKLLSLSPEALVTQLLSSVQIGYLTAATTNEVYAPDHGLACRFCGASLATIDEKNIIGGPSSGNRFNDSLKRISERFCVRCALSSYLSTKRLGMQFDGIFPVPKLYNVIFHYGRHIDWELEALQRQIDYLLAHVGEGKKTDELLSELQQLREQVAQTHNATVDIDEIDFESWEGAALGIIEQMQRDVQAEIIPLGSGDCRLLVFILPQLRPGSQEGMDFVQQRFSGSRLAIYTLLGLLRKLCGCDGSYYFQSTPTLSPGGFDSNTFYVSGRAEQADAALKRYGVIADFARRVVRYRSGHSSLADWILLAEQIERNPLGVFSDVLRNSPLRGGDNFRDFRYQRLSNDFIPGMAVVDSTEYLSLFERLRQMQVQIQA